MSRDIRFRAWDKIQKILWPVKTIDSQKGLITFGNGSFTGKRASREDYELMQYIGLKDKNGVEIYEGDVVNIEFNQGTNLKARPVIWSDKNAAFAVDNGELHEGLNGIIDAEVIGNIFENLKLLREEEQP